MSISRILIILLVFFNFCYAKSFIIDDIRVSGLQRMTVSGFLNYMPFKSGSILNETDYPKIIKILYKSGFFEDITLSRDGNNLLVKVKERPVIGEINIKGNKEIKDNFLLKGLVSLGIVKGESFSYTKLLQVKKELLDLYYSRSKFDVIVDMNTSTISKGIVKLDINIKEGVSARIKQINIVGNRAFSEKELLSKINLSSSNWYSLFTKEDQYSGEKLRADLDIIETYYFNRGYLDFKINSTEVSLTDDKKYVYITINLTEGLPYKVNSNVFVVDNSIIKNKTLENILNYDIGSYYSRNKVRESQVKIKNIIGEKGYAFANVNVIPKINKVNHTVALQYDISYGKKIYVRNIEFTGNYKTNDEVLRREMRQLESSLYNFVKLRRSDERIRHLSYISYARHREVPVAGKDDQVDIIYEVKEVPNRSITGGVGYGSSSGLSFNAGYKTANFFGTGNSFNFNFTMSRPEKDYSLAFTDPYFTVNGVGRTFSLYYNKLDKSKADIGSWASDNAGAFISFGLPVNEYEDFSIGAGYRRVNIKEGKYIASEIHSFLNDNGKKFNEFVLNFNWTHDTRDKSIFSTKGSITSVNSEFVMPGSSQTYYNMGIKNRSYFKIANNLLFSMRSDIAYGKGYKKTKNIPFFRNFYAGGVSTVRGFVDNSLGPRWSNNNIKGGAFLITGGAEIIIPWRRGEGLESVRTGLFTDIGNVYSSIGDFKINDLRYSAGAYILWNSPIGALNLSYAVPINKKKKDNVERLQFTMGLPL